MKGIMAALALVLLAIFLAVVLLKDGGEDGLQRPGEEPADAPGPAEPLPTLPDQPAVEPEAESPAEQVTVLTNVPGASITLTIRLYGGAPDPAPLTATADDVGNAAFGVPEVSGPIVEMIAEARAPGYRAASERVRDGVAHLTLVTGVPIRGVIVDPGNAPVPDAIVKTAAGDFEYSDSTGAFEVYVTEDGPTELAVSHPARLNTTVQIDAPAEGVKIVLERGLTISGRVSFPDGKPVPGVGLQVSEQHALAMTGDDGRYTLAGFEPGSVTVRCWATGEKKPVEVGASGIDFVLKAHVVRMRYLDEEGRPFRNASLWVQGYLDGKDVMSMAGSAGDDGLHQLDRVPTGVELRICPSAPGYAEKITTVRIDGEPRVHEIEIAMAPAGPTGTLELLVLDDMGDPRSHASISLTNDAGSPVRGLYRKLVELDAEGRARLDVPAGHYQLDIGDSTAYASLEGYALTSTHEIEVIAGNTLPVEAVVHTGGRLRLLVKDPNGEITAVRRARLFDSEGKQLQAWFIRVLDGGWTTDLDEPGPALLGKPVAPGRYRLRVIREEKIVAEREVDVTAGHTTEVEIQLPR